MTLAREFVGRAETLGYHSLWVQEQVLGATSVLEPLSILSYVAALTSNIRLGVSVLVLPFHSPLQLAKRISSVDQLSQGRLVVGLGLGGGTSLYPTFGLSAERRVRRFVEALEIMKALWTVPVTQYSGRFWQVEGVSMEPKPTQQPYPPVWFGGRHPNVLKRAVKHANGWMGAGSSSIADFQEQVIQVKMFMEEAKRDPSTFAISKRVYIAIDDDQGRAERRLRDWFGQYYRNADMASRVSVWGSAAHCIEPLAEVAEAGAEHVLINPVFDHMEHVETLAAELGLTR